MKSLISLFAVVGLIVPAATFASAPAVSIDPVVPVGCGAQTITITGDAHIHTPFVFNATRHLFVTADGTEKVHESVTGFNVHDDFSWSFSENFDVGTHTIEGVIKRTSPTPEVVDVDTSLDFTIDACAPSPSPAPSSPPENDDEEDKGSITSGGYGFCHRVDYPVGEQHMCTDYDAGRVVRTLDYQGSRGGDAVLYAKMREVIGLMQRLVLLLQSAR